MKLNIVREQKDMKGLLRGHKGVQFCQTIQLKVSPDEQALISRYKMEDQVLGTFKSDKKGGEDGNLFDKDLTVGYLLKGDTLVSQNVGKIQEIENTLVEACRNLKNYLAVAATFGDSIEIEID